jgi:hypothetical protein
MWGEIMLGELILQETGHVTAMRVLPDGDGVHPVVEVSFQAAGQFLGTDASDIGTYRSVTRPDGSLFGEGQGVVMTADGGTVAWKGEGVGKFTGPGSVSWRGAIYFQTESEAFTRLNGVAGVFEYEADADGKITSKLYEWA